MDVATLVLRRDGQEREIISSSNALSRCSHTIRQRLRAGCSSCVQAVRGAYSKCPSLSRSATLTHDGLTAAASLADMVTDLLVLREFYEKGLTGFFALQERVQPNLLNPHLGARVKHPGPWWWRGILAPGGGAASLLAVASCSTYHYRHLGCSKVGGPDIF